MWISGLRLIEAAEACGREDGCCVVGASVRHTPHVPSFQTRQATGDAHEKRVTQELNRRGWHVGPRGQGIIGEPVRLALHSTTSSPR